MNLTTRPINNVTTTSSSSSAQPSLTPLLCYACHTTLTSRGTRGGGGIAAPPPQPPGQFATTQVLPLPMWVHNRLNDDLDHDHHGIVLKTTKLNEKEMKAEIEEFLLPDE